jgi:hypothetical protein
MTLTESECREAARADIEVRRFDKLRRGRWYIASFVGIFLGFNLNNLLADRRFEIGLFVIPSLCVVYCFRLARNYQKNLEKLSLLGQREPRLRHWLEISRGNPGRMADAA